MKQSCHTSRKLITQTTKQTQQSDGSRLTVLQLQIVVPYVQCLQHQQNVQSSSYFTCSIIGANHQTKFETVIDQIAEFLRRENPDKF